MDKRTKKYKECMKKNSKGLGDKIEAITKATGIKKVVEAITDDCGCDERIAYLNTIGVRAKGCMSEESKAWWSGFELKTRVEEKDVDAIIKAYGEVFNIDNSRMCKSCGNAGRTLRRMYNQLAQYAKASNL